jgi:hypothetical protein
MDNLPLGAEFDSNAPFNEQEENYCKHCSVEIDENKSYCSKACCDYDVE